MTNQHEQHLRNLLTEAHQLLDQLTQGGEADEQTFALAYQLGYHAGHDVGRRQAEDELHKAWATMAAKVRATANQPTHADLAARRIQPGGDMWEKDQARHGGRPYLGGPVDYDTGQPATNDDPWATLPGAAA